MTTQDLTNNRDRIVKKIKSQISLATKEQIIDVMKKMVAMLPQFADEKPLMKNIDKLAIKATLSYIKHGKVNTAQQNEYLDRRIEENKRQSMPSSLQF